MADQQRQAALVDGIGRRWDTETAAAALVFGALGFLFLVRRGMRGVLVRLGG